MVKLEDTKDTKGTKGTKDTNGKLRGSVPSPSGSMARRPQHLRLPVV